MGVDFYLERIKKKKVRKSDAALPKIEARFAFTEYPRFLRELAHDAGLGDVWNAYADAGRELMERTFKILFAGFDWANPPALKNKKERRRERRQRGTKSAGNPLDRDPVVQELRQKVDDAHDAVSRLAAQEPLIEFLLSSTDNGRISSASCGRIAPRLRAVAENWEPAPEGWVGWRERALEIADAMELAGQSGDVVLHISG
jgi:hypothetical protein